MKPTTTKELLIKYNAGQCTEAEIALIESWYIELAGDPVEPSPETFKAETAAIRKHVLDHIKEKVKIISMPNRAITIAAAIMLLTGIITYISRKDSTYSNVYANDLKPGSDKAILTLANGKRIDLTNAKSGELSAQPGVKITKTSAGQLTFEITKLDKQSGDYIVETPRGGQFQIVLPDGTKVWLNAGSFLKLPSTYVSSKHRKVELSGEAYFEVTKDQQHPFVVKSNGQELTVLGTHFDVNAYTDEQFTKTTLLEGAVRITPSFKGFSKGADAGLSQPVVLKPGLQSLISDRTVQVQPANVELEMAWKNGSFEFFRADIRTVMRQLARWYDVDVYYEGALPKTEFTGEISRSIPASQALALLSDLKVNFKIEGKKITVIGNK